MTESADRENNFDTMRLLAALTVLVSHSIPLTYGTNATEIIYRASRGQVTAGTLAVEVFFAISGYLITASFIHSRHPARFVMARALRLLPGLAVALLLAAFVAGPALSTFSPAEFFGSPQPYRYVILNLLMQHTEGLPGLFTSNPYRGAVNGSLWTLRYESECYLLVFCLGMLRILNRRWILVAYGISLVASAFWITGMRFVLMSIFLGGGDLPLEARA